MASLRKCLKCGYERTHLDQGPEEACPKCGAVYAKVAKVKVQPRAVDSLERGVGVQIVSAVMYTLAALSVLSGIILFFSDIRSGTGAISLLVGVSSAATLSAIALALRYLRGIYVNTLKR